jgi:hypothetical protein
VTSRSQRRAPDAEWVLMYRKGLTRARIAELENVSASTVAYHLSVAKAQDEGLQWAHDAAAEGSPAARVTGRTLERMNGLITMVRTEGRYPSSKAGGPEERSLAVWLQRRRRNTTEGRLAPEVRDGLACLPVWQGTPHAAADEERWQQRLSELAEYRAGGPGLAPPQEHGHADGARSGRLAAHPAVQTAPRRTRPCQEESPGRCGAGLVRGPAPGQESTSRTGQAGQAGLD